jgi:UDP-N-acetylmuramyl tripeptide synthase
MRVLDSRRLTGPSLLLDHPGAILDVALDGIEPEAAVVAWKTALAQLLRALGWPNAASSTRVHAAGLSLAFRAPADALYAATEVNEAAWRLALRTLEGAADTPTAEELAPLHEAIERERKPWWATLAAEAKAHDVTLLMDDKRVSVGLGAGSRAWPVEETARVLERLGWKGIFDVPTALVTGTNGKTTTVRLLGAIARAAGLTAGVTSTDAVTVGDEVVATGDYSGPNGARTVLRDRRVEVAMLEVARGGILRRGLALPHVRAALVTNVANDHLGEFGIFDLDSLADVKLVVAKAIGPAGRLVLNADDALLLERGARLTRPICWFTLDARHPVLAPHRKAGGPACVLEDGRLVFWNGAQRHDVASVGEVPIAFGGSARHNVANALGAVGVAFALGLPLEAIRDGLRGFEPTAHANPGRANVWRLGTVTVIVDFAHNPHGLEALVEMTSAMPAKRRALVIGQAGDRDDESIAQFAKVAWAMAPRHVFIKEMEIYLRGREPGVVPALIERELRAAGAADGDLSHWGSELEAVRAALEWARDGDLLVLTTHAQREEVVGLLQRLAESGWSPTRPLPQPAPLH